ncbi:hypothetical protein EGH10_17475 [Brevibacillus laterosporus]|uniref:Uncharacterized protein n=1 Tax=Brevibacillus laterosporus LMG 15441 TaxID=1042163 RepID=A0A075R4K3_BRELA|nr:hypothetical protein BRLA_c017900 [Brevibacillus laterosporus LMG 15441]RJL06129.1 hypothetical protein DM460_22315 [Brevibacillus laterosporus]TPH07251.1 hypothetical protein EGH10_17475 [Brevibacillus laterosporus]
MKKKLLTLLGIPTVSRNAKKTRKKSRMQWRRKIFRLSFKSLEVLSLILRIAHIIFEFLKK